MLSHLHIRDFAIIDVIEMDLTNGLTVLTGETGAGKSILVDALQLAVGGRGGSESIRHGAERAEITATFDISTAPKGLLVILEEQSIETGDELVVRRVLTREGKSRAYLNGQQVPLQILRTVGESLAEIHGQHEFQSLVKSSAQRELLDAFGGHNTLAAEITRLHRERVQHSAALESLEAAARDRDARLDLLRHQTSELAALSLKPGELQSLTDERSRLANSGRLSDAARHALELLYESENTNAHHGVSRALAILRQGASLDPTLEALLPTLEEAAIRIADGARELTRYLESIEANPRRQEHLEQRLFTIESLARKHRCSCDELVAKSEELADELSKLERIDAKLSVLRAQVNSAVEAWREAAVRLSNPRRQAATALATEISARMQKLGMIGGYFTIELTPLENPQGNTSPNGLEEIAFLVSTNAGQPARPIGKIASGGELSRLSLAVQVALVGRVKDLASGGCMVFDEVDSGVGGAVAEIVGRELAALGSFTQVLCVTHLPQVAALGGQHLRLSKMTDGHTTRTQVIKLERDSRIEEIARMLGGVSITDKTRAHAAEMLDSGAKLNRCSSSRGAGNSSVDSARKSRGHAR
ncbi:MAG: DNA repair protein RecN [Gammaproteobacteria bacterium]|nr:DNA repair protein RecN [Gammaproteobacteria bacterium]